MKENEQSNPHLNAEYRSRINRVIDYIEKNINHEFTLDELAGIACFSKYHFHRIFSSIMNETLFDFIQRSRVEKAASLLLANQETAVTVIAHTCGFSSHALFTRTFNRYFKMNPTKWRKVKSNSNQVNSNVIQEECNHGKELDHKNVYVEYAEKTNYWRFSMNTQHQVVEVKELPDMTVAYVRHIGPYKGDEALFGRLFGKLCKWAGPRNLIGKDAKFLTVYHDDHKITEENKLRISVSLVVPSNTEVSGEIGRMTIAGGKYAISRFVLSKDEFMQAWDWVYGTWLPQSGYQPDDKPAFELFAEEPRDDKYTVDIYAPVKPL